MPFTSLVKICGYLVAGFLIFGAITNLTPEHFVFSESCLSGDTNDRDGDDIPDKWEENGADTNKDRKIDVNLPAKNVSSAHKDILLEIDYMKDHQPYAQVIPNVIKAFSNAPVCNPDGTTGIKLHIQLDEEIPYKKSLKVWDDYDKLSDKFFGTSAERRDHNHDEIIYAKEKIYHYAIFGHMYEDPDTKEDDSDSSGVSDQPGMYILVTLGNSSNNPEQNTTTAEYQEGTLMHELGHNLGLDHGGKDDINCKPNYLSVMNYAFQFPNPLLKRPLDYSRSPLLTLKEKNLNESSGISQSTPPGLMTVYGPGETRNATTGNPIHWNLDTDFDDANLPEDINYLEAIDGCDEKPNETLKGFDDWRHIIYDDALHKPHKNTVANILSKLTSNTSSLESSNFSPIMISNGSSTTRHNESDVPNELTSYDVKRLNLQLASTLKDTISNLSDTSFQQYPQNSILSLSDKEKSKNSEAARSYYEDKIGNTSLLELTPYNESRNTNDTTITGYIKSGKIDNAISSLNALLPTMDSSTGGIGSNDKIINSSSQQHIAGLIDNAVEILKHQTCTYSNCTIINKAPNATIEY